MKAFHFISLLSSSCLHLQQSGFPLSLGYDDVQTDFLNINPIWCGHLSVIGPVRPGGVSLQQPKLVFRLFLLRCNSNIDQIVECDSDERDKGGNT